MLFAFETNPPKEAKSTAPVIERPARVRATLDDIESSDLKQQLGEGCGPEDVRALALSGNTKDGYDVVVLPEGGCNAGRLSLDAAKINAADEPALPKAKSKKKSGG